MSDVDEMRLIEVGRILKEAITNPKEKVVGRFIVWCLESFINEENLRNAIEEDLDILTLTFNHYGLGHSRLTRLYRLVFKMYWNEVEEHLTDVQKMVELLSKKPGCSKLISTKAGVDYLNRCCEDSYNRLYDFVWLGEQIA